MQRLDDQNHITVISFTRYVRTTTYIVTLVRKYYFGIHLLFGSVKECFMPFVTFTKAFITKLIKNVGSV